MVGKIKNNFNEIIFYLDKLINQLYYKEYFGFIETADHYVDSIYSFMENDIHTFPHKKNFQKVTLLKV